MQRNILLALMLFLPFAAGADQATDEAVTEILKKNIRMVRHLALNPLLVEAAQRQNAGAAGPDTRADAGPLPDTAIGEARRAGPRQGYHSLMMQGFIDRHDDFSQAVLTDREGTNVAAYPSAGDYWQDEEDGWRNAFNEGRGQVYISPLEQDPATGVISTYIAAPVLRRDEAVGVLMVAVELDDAGG